MDTRKFDNPADMFFSDIIPPAADEQQTETSKLIQKDEKLTKKILLSMKPSIHELATIKAKSQGRSFNNYVNQLIMEDLETK